MRCPDCNKFVSFEEIEPEVESIEVNDQTVNATVRIVNACADCSTELTEATFEVEAEHSELKAHTGSGHELSIEQDSCERTQRSGYFKKGVFVPAYGRYAKNFYGMELSYTITCSCSLEFKLDGSLSDEVQASSMDELV